MRHVLMVKILKENEIETLSYNLGPGCKNMKSVPVDSKKKKN